MTVKETLAPAVAALRAEEARLAFAIQEIERELERSGEVDLAQPTGETAAVVDTLFDATMRLLSLTSVQGADVRGKAFLLKAALDLEKLRITNHRSQVVAEEDEVRQREARVAEVARAQEAAAREAALLTEGDPAAYARWKARQTAGVPAGAR